MAKIRGERKRIGAKEFQVYKDGFYNVNEYCKYFNTVLGFCEPPAERKESDKEYNKKVNEKRKEQKTENMT